MSRIIWNISRKGRSWGIKEVRQRYSLAPDKIELIKGKLFWSERDRMRMLGLLLENVGIDKAIRLGDARLWREALSELENSQ